MQKKQRRTVQYGLKQNPTTDEEWHYLQEFCRVRICCKLLTCILIPLYKL